MDGRFVPHWEQNTPSAATLEHVPHVHGMVRGWKNADLEAPVNAMLCYHPIVIPKE